MSKGIDLTKRLTIQRERDCDIERLYGPLDTAIAYLEEIKTQQPDARLDEHWFDYESMELRWVWYSEETDEELEARLERMKQEERTKNLLDRKIKERADILKQIETLKLKAARL
jgi:hypothetical protein